MRIHFISLSLESNAIEIFASIIFWLGFNGYYIRNQRIHYKKNRLFEINEQREEQKYIEIEQKEKLEKSGTLRYGGGSSIYVDPLERKIYYNYSTISSLSESKTIEEYHIENRDVPARCIEYKYENLQWNQNINYILDGIVQESEILKEENNKHEIFKKTNESLIQYINDLKKSTEWNIVQSNILKYFILFQHKVEIPYLKKYLIAERERIRGGFLKYKNFIKNDKDLLEIKVSFRKYEVFINSEKTEDEIKIIISKIHSDLKSFNLTYQEFEDSRKISMFLYFLINKF